MFRIKWDHLKHFQSSWLVVGTHRNGCFRRRGDDTAFPADPEGPGDLRVEERYQSHWKKKNQLFEFKCVTYYYPDTRIQSASFWHFMNVLWKHGACFKIFFICERHLCKFFKSFLVLHLSENVNSEVKSFRFDQWPESLVLPHCVFCTVVLYLLPEFLSDVVSASLPVFVPVFSFPLLSCWTYTWSRGVISFSAISVYVLKCHCIWTSRVCFVSLGSLAFPVIKSK